MQNKQIFLSQFRILLTMLIGVFFLSVLQEYSQNYKVYRLRHGVIYVNVIHFTFNMKCILTLKLSLRNPYIIGLTKLLDIAIQ